MAEVVVMVNKKVKSSQVAAAPQWKRLGITGLVVGGAASLVSVGAARYVVDQMIGTRPATHDEGYTFTPFETNVAYEEVSFPTANQRMLSGWLFPHANERRVVVAVSGYRGKKEDMLGIGSFLWRSGYNVLLFDYRAHGLNRKEGELVTLGHCELEDLQAAIHYVRSRIERPLLGLLGGSMGAAVVLTAAARDPEIMAVWADSPFASQREIIAHVWRKDTHLPGRPVLDIAARMFEARTGYRWADFEPLKEIGRIAPRPVFLVHGAADSMVPVDCVYRLYAAAGQPKELWIEDGLEHCGVYFARREEYTRRAAKFFDTYLVDQATSTSLHNSTSLVS
jgi:uncharacterized protein